MYSIRALDPLPGDFMSVPTAINNHGRVVGGSSQGDYSTQRAVVWGSPRPYELGELVATYSPTNLQPSLDAGALASIANDINDEGEIVGYWWRILDAHNTSTRAFKLAVAGAYTALPPLAERDGSAAFAINASGDVVGQSADATQPGPWGWHAVRWPAGGGTVDLGRVAEDTNTLPKGQWGYTAYGINTNGEICGRVSALSATHAFRWDAASGLVALAPIASGIVDGDDSIGWAINNAGAVVGHSGFQLGPHLDGTGVVPTVWHPGQGPLPIFGAGGRRKGRVDGSAHAVNKYGASVGIFADSSGRNHAWLFDGVLHDLNDVIDPSSGWYLYDAVDINDRGQIVGMGVFRDPADPSAPPNSSRAFLLTPPKLSPRTVELEHWVTEILAGVRTDEPGVVWPPGSPIGPVDPWTGRAARVPLALQGIVSALRVLHEARGLSDGEAQEKIGEVARAALIEELTRLLRGISGHE